MSFLTKLPRDRYRSDAFARFRVDHEGFNPGVARAMAWMSQLSYETDEPAKIADIAAKWAVTILPGGIISEEVATPLPKASTQVIVGNHDSATIITFAGTDPLVLADWITDFDLNITDAGTANGLAVAAEAVWPKVRALLQSAQARAPVVVTGHSLGGALAVLTAARINALAPGRVRAVYTFGMPRAGDPEFAAAYDQALGSARTVWCMRMTWWRQSRHPSWDSGMSGVISTAVAAADSRIGLRLKPLAPMSRSSRRACRSSSGTFCTGRCRM